MVVSLQVTEVAFEEQEVSVGPVQLIRHPLEHVRLAWQVFQEGAGIPRSPSGGICSWTSSAWRRGVVGSKEARGDSWAVIGTEKKNRKKETRKTKLRSRFMALSFLGWGITAFRS